MTAPQSGSTGLGRLRSTMRLQRPKSQRLVTTTPDTIVGAALESVKPQISPKLLLGLHIQKVSTRGTVVPRVLTLSDDLFKLFVSHHKVGRARSLADRLHYRSFKACASTVSLVTGIPVQAKHNIRVIDVADILFVQSGFVGSRKLEACSRQLEARRKPELDPAKVISIYHKNVNTTDFIVEDEEDRKAVLSAIQTIREAYDAAKAKMSREELLLRYAWYDIDWNKSGLIEQSEFLQLLGRINIYLKKERAIKIFKDCLVLKRLKNERLKGSISVRRMMRRTPYHHGITFDECLDALETIKLEHNGGHLMTDIIFNELFGDKDVVSAEEFLTKFLQTNQNEQSSTLDGVRRIFFELNSMRTSRSRIGADGKSAEDSIDRVRFGEYLFSSGNDLFDPEKQKLSIDTLSRPLPEFWINSSHNTYLTGNQFQSESSVQMYIVAMQR
jgi:hypothetical protein